MPSINDLVIKVIEKEMSHTDEFKITVIISMFRMISKVCFYIMNTILYVFYYRTPIIIVKLYLVICFIFLFLSFK